MPRDERQQKLFDAVRDLQKDLSAKTAPHYKAIDELLAERDKKYAELFREYHSVTSKEGE